MVIAEERVFLWRSLEPDQLEQRLDWLVGWSISEPGLNGEVAPKASSAGRGQPGELSN